MIDAGRTAMATEHLIFRAAGEGCGIAILRVQEVIRFESAIRVPGTPPSILGVFSYRGRAVPVVDLAVKLGLSPCRVTEKACVILVDVAFDAKNSVIGILADEVLGMEEFSREDLAPPPPGCPMGERNVIGVGKAGGDRILVLDVDHILSSDEAIRGDAAASNKGE